MLLLSSLFTTPEGEYKQNMQASIDTSEAKLEQSQSHEACCPPTFVVAFLFKCKPASTDSLRAIAREEACEDLCLHEIGKTCTRSWAPPSPEPNQKKNPKPDLEFRIGVWLLQLTQIDCRGRDM